MSPFSAKSYIITNNLAVITSSPGGQRRRARAARMHAHGRPNSARPSGAQSESSASISPVTSIQPGQASPSINETSQYLFPKETLMRILDFATWKDLDKSFALEERSVIDRSPQLPMNSSLIKQDRERILTTQSIQRVSRYWRSVGVEFLFRYISCSSQDDDMWASLVKRLDPRDDFSCTLGMRVLSISLNMSKGGSSYKKVQSAIQILLGCRKVQHVKLHFENNRLMEKYALSLIVGTMATSGKALRRLDIDMGYYFDEGVVLSSISHCPGLEILNVSNAYGECGDDFILDEQNLQKLHTISLSSCIDDRFILMRSWGMSNFRHLSIFGAFETDVAMPFFHCFGPQLQSLEVSVPTEDFEIVLEKCTNLQDIVVSIKSFVTHSMVVSRFDFRHSNVSRVGIRHIDSQTHPFLSMKSSLEDIIESLADKACFPNLSVVRFIDLKWKTFVKMLDDPSWLEMWTDILGRLDRADIFVQSGNGGPMSVEY